MAGEQAEPTREGMMGQATCSSGIPRNPPRAWWSGYGMGGDRSVMERERGSILTYPGRYSGTVPRPGG